MFEDINQWFQQKQAEVTNQVVNSVQNTILDLIATYAPYLIVAVLVTLFAILVFFKMMSFIGKKSLPVAAAILLVLGAISIVYVRSLKPTPKPVVVVAPKPVTPWKLPDLPEVDLTPLLHQIEAGATYAGNLLKDGALHLRDAMADVQWPSFDLSAETAQEQMKRMAEIERQATLARRRKEREEREAWRRRNAEAGMMIDQYIANGIQEAQEEYARQWNAMYQQWYMQTGQYLHPQELIRQQAVLRQQFQQQHVRGKVR